MKKNFVCLVSALTAIVFLSFGCGKKSETTLSENSAANYPLPEPPVVVNCTPGNLGGKFVVSAIGEPKTFNYIMANESSSIDIDRLLFGLC